MPQDQQGNTALHWSCLLGLQSLTSLLLAHEARTDIRNEKGSYAVHAAVSGRNVPAMKLLSGEKSSQTSRRLLLLRDAKDLTAFLAAAEINDDAWRKGQRRSVRGLHDGMALPTGCGTGPAQLQGRDGGAAARNVSFFGSKSRGSPAARATRAPCSGCHDLKTAAM